ncbi:hypothetical protein HN018_27985 (plasmid) [Lichenicola cladoniae]|uniref:Uncharacterized protein n=1 Tax=Lichenicola cladoniae TaxID=1484109 RepID=A0A6M8HZG6_9PROT|nr:hypothetical protein [Lichenicola cladoniae]NPD69661.1 hypothetical protein [Acetobacteraceae bacterium]QKE93964.1 hypothetical protein HN018_27985 [Lichenicola cladoniae]
MSDEAEDRLYGLIEIAERHQAAVQAALEGLAVERAALKAERERLGQDVNGLSRTIRTAVQGGVAESMFVAAETGASALKAATGPLLGRLDQVGTIADQAEATLRRVVLWASWRLLGWGIAAIAALGMMWWLASSAVLWWDAGAIGQAQEQKGELEAQIAELRANKDGWERAGMLAKITQCGPRSRPCVRVDENAGQFDADGHGDYRVIQGY